MDKGMPAQALDVTQGHLETITKANQQNSLLLKLPAELRNRIYEAVCLDSTVLVLPRYFVDQLEELPPYSAKHRSGLGLVKVCRQIRHEAMSTLLQHTTFDLGLLLRSGVKKRDWNLRKVARSIVIDVRMAGDIILYYEGQDTRRLALYSANLPCLEHVFVRMNYGCAVNVQDSFQEAAKMTFGCKSPQVHILS